MMIPTFSVFDRKYPVWENLAQKLKIVSLSWNLMPRLIQICKILWWCLSFLFSNGNTLFGGKFDSKNYYFSLSWNLVPKLIQMSEIPWWYLLFLFYTGTKYPFWSNLVLKFKIVCLKWYLLPRIFRICKTWRCCSLFLS